MKANIVKSAIIALLFFVINPINIKAESDATLYHNVEKEDNMVSTTYFKGDNKNENLTPFKKKVNIMNTDGICVAKITYLWDANDESWIPLDKVDFEYTGSQVKKINRYAWDATLNNWGKPEQISYN